MAIATLDAVIAELVDICGEEHVHGGIGAVQPRACPALSPAHRWADYIPDVVAADERRADLEVVKLANRERIPRPTGRGNRADGRGRSARHGILVDVKLMNQIHEIDLTIARSPSGPGSTCWKLAGAAAARLHLSG